MLPSSDRYNPFSCTNQTLFGQSSVNDENPNSGREEPPFWFSYFPSPFLDDDDQLLGQPVPQQQFMVSGNDLAEIEVTGNTVSNRMPSRVLHSEKTTDGARKPNPPRRTGKKDRHSKINTAHGLRDRRMRLSLPIARKFFDLQDMLGFDKASKTIEWLFTKSKVAIKEITRNLPQMKNSCRIGGRTASSMHECLAASGLDQETANDEAKEIAAKGFYSPFEAGEEEPSYTRCQEKDSSLDHQLAIVDIIETFLGTPSLPASCSIHQNNTEVSGGID
ncbi:hypothetical protein F0562_032779 [Nyssa sinensis]|uniref:TCP domain-containing protein n=1 Tax=Nyssa sinensis TaxID=561372 RepID=A0A5J5ASB8_9ASTE|nr:hypothetical protein F0562_032779 [Nyssa sinensis]